MRPHVRSQSSTLVFKGGTMSVQRHRSPPPTSTNGNERSEPVEQLDAIAARYGNRILHELAPDDALPERGMRAVDAMQGHHPPDPRLRRRRPRRVGSSAATSTS